MANYPNVEAALRTIPVGRLPLDLLDLGAIYAITNVSGEVSVTWSPPGGCISVDTISNQIAERILQVEGVRRVNVMLSFDPPWTKEKVDEELRAYLGI